MTTARLVTSLLVVLLLASCAKEVPPAEKFVRSRLPGELSDVFYSADKKIVCGSVVGKSANHLVRFYSKWQEMEVEYEGSEHFSVRSYVDACQLGWSDEKIAIEEQRIADDLANQKKERDQVARQEAHDRWLEQNAEAITSMHEAAQRARDR